MSEADSYDILVDVDAWSSTRAALAEVVAGVVGVAVPRVRSVLDVPGAPVSMATSRSDAERMVARLAELGVRATVRERRGARSLLELTGRASTLGAAAPVSASVTDESGAAGRTLTPGWKARENGAQPAPGGTVVGIPARSEDLSATVVGATSAETADFPVAEHAGDPKSPDGARADTGDSPVAGGRPAGAAAGWAGVLGDALSERLVARVGFDDTIAPGAAGIALLDGGTEEVTPKRVGPSRPSPAPVPRPTDEASGPDQPDPESGTTFVAPTSGATLDPRAAGVAARSAIASGGAGAPPARPSAAARGSDRDTPSSAWARAGVDVRAAVEAAPQRARSVKAPAAGADVPTPTELDDLARGETLVFEPGDAVPPGIAPAEGTLSVGDRFVRMRPPADLPPMAPSPVRAAAWGLAAPGGGFAYLGEPRRGIGYALGAILVVPWIKGAVDAAREAAEIREGRRLQGRRPQPQLCVKYAAAFWLVVVVAVAGFVTLRAALRGGDAPSAAEQAGVVVPVDTATTSGFTGPPSEEEIPTATPDVESADDTLERVRRLEELLLEARRACDAGRYFECRRYAEEALAIDDRNREATLLHVRSVTQGVVAPPPDTPQESGNDRQPDRPTAPR